MSTQAFAWISSVVCVALASKTATAFCKTRPRLFTICALFALVWALLLPYYGVEGSSQLFVAYGGFILVYIGGLLSLEAAQQASETRTVDVIQRIGLWIFVLLASPGVLQLTVPGTRYELTRPQSELLLATLLDIAGFTSVSYGFWHLCGRRPGIPLMALLVFYSLAEVAFTIVAWPPATDNPRMPDYFRVGFGLLKLLLGFYQFE